jgi:DNA-binding NarL/FixJ family response regulator
VADQADAEAALLAALRGEGLIVHATAPRDVVDRLVDDLRRLGGVDHRIGTPDEAPRVSNEARAILGLLAEGHSLGEAAAILGLSRRTADRRLAEGRRALGTDRTTEAIARARHQGWLGREPTDPT